MKRVFVILTLALITKDAVCQVQKEIDSLVSLINHSALKLRLTITPDTISMLSKCFKEDYFVNESGKPAKVRSLNCGTVSSLTNYYFFNKRLIKVESGINKGDSILNKSEYYFRNGRSVSDNKKEKNIHSYYLGKARSLLDTFKN